MATVTGPRSTALLAVLLLLLGGCDRGDDDDTTPADDDTADDDTADDDTADDDSAGDDDSGDDDTTPPPEEPLLDSIDPTFGPLAGGIEVQLFGDHFTAVADTVVRFGATEAQVVSVEPQRITATAPAIPVPQTLSVSVTTSGGSAVLDDAYTAGDDYTGLTGVISRYWRVRVLDNSVPSNPFTAGIWAETRVVTPLSYALAGEVPSPGSCIRDFAPPSASFTPRDAGAEVTYDSGSYALALPVTNDGWYEATAPNADWESQQAYDLIVPGGAGFVAHTVTDALVTPHSSLTVDPDLSDHTAHELHLGGSLVFTISGGQPAERLVIWLDFYDGSDQHAGNLVCTFSDETSPLISPAFLAGLPEGHAVVQVFRQNRQIHVLTEGSQLATEARVMVVGGLSVVP